MLSSYHINDYQSGQGHVFGCGGPDKLAAKKPGIIYAPGGGGLATSWQTGTATNPNIVNKVIRVSCERPIGVSRFRFVSFASEWTWGNQTSVDRISDLYAYANVHHSFSAAKVHLLGVSMGAACVLNWAKANLAKVASIALLIPAVDVQDIDDNNRATAYGLPAPSTAYGDVRPPDADTPARHAGIYQGIPIKIWYSTNDTIVIPEIVQTFASQSGATLISLGSLPPDLGIPGHGLSNQFNPESVPSFFETYP